MVIRHQVEGYENFLKTMDSLKVSEPIHVLYTGSKLPNGHSWCPDCVVGKFTYNTFFTFTFYHILSDGLKVILLFKVSIKR